MRVVFMGTPDFAATILEELSFRHEVACVYTRADAVRGRGSKMLPSPVKAMAESLGIEVRTPATLRDAQEQAALAALAPDVICVAAYGMLLPREVLDIPLHGCLNVHASLLPRWRGAAPVERAILAGDAETGVCIMRMEEGLDTGDYCIWRSAFIGDKSADALTDELANLGAHALLTALAHIEHGAIRWIAQGDEGMTYAAKIERAELFLSPADTALAASRKVQAASDAHPARCAIGGRGVSVSAACLPERDDPVAPVLEGLSAGAVRFVSKRLFLGCGEGVLEVLRVKPDGKQAMDAKAFAAGVQNIKAGSVEWGAADGR